MSNVTNIFRFLMAICSNLSSGFLAGDLPGRSGCEAGADQGARNGLKYLSVSISRPRYLKSAHIIVLFFVLTLSEITNFCFSGRFAPTIFRSAHVRV